MKTHNDKIMCVFRELGVYSAFWCQVLMLVLPFVKVQAQKAHSIGQSVATVRVLILRTKLVLIHVRVRLASPSLFHVITYAEWISSVAL